MFADDEVMYPTGLYFFRIPISSAGFVAVIIQHLIQLNEGC